MMHPGTLLVSYSMRSCVLYDDWYMSNPTHLASDGTLVLVLARPIMVDSKRKGIALVLCDGIVGWLYVDSTLSV